MTEEFPEPPAAARRVRYDQGCAAAHALNLVGDRWALLVVRELMLTPKRFQALRAGLPGVTPGVLTGRLDQLADAGIVTHDPDTSFYALTGHGYALRPVLRELGRWGAGRLGHDPRRFLSPTSLMMSLGVMADRGRTAGSRAMAGFDLGRERFLACFGEDGEPHVQPTRDPGAAALVFEGSPNAVAFALYGPGPVVDAVASGALVVRGDADAAQAFADLFGAVELPAG